TMQLNTPSDSIKLIAAVKAFWIDSEQINTAFFNKIGLLPMDKTPSAAPYYLRNLKPGLHKLIKAGRNIWAEYPGLVWAYFFFLFSGLWLIYRHNRAVFISSLFAQTWGIMLFTGITVLMKMETWVLAPMIWCAIMVNAIWCIKVLSGNGLVKSKALSLSIGAGVMLSAVLLGGTVDFMKWKSYRHELHTMDEIRQAVNKLPQHNVLASLSFMIRLHTQPFQPKPLYNKSLICLDNWFLFLYPEFNTFMDREFGTAQPVKAMQALLAKRDDVVFVSTIDRADMMSRYFNTVHNMALNFSGVPGLGPYYLGKKVDGRTVFIYRIE
ncbi:MAG TPA: hypothetical protein VG603_01135, partial [Chitinophagales bacterium]|nr:hypothetical protein [Chitinophagales bacterium]